MGRLSDVMREMKFKAPAGPRLAAYKCKTCRDIGWVSYSYPVGHPLHGKTQACPDCGQGRQFSQVADSAGLLPSERSMSWEKILELENSNVAEAKQAVMEVVRRGWGWVYLWGTYGTAKTIMLKTAAVEWMKSTGRPACFTTMADLLDTVREAYHPHAPNGESLRRLRHYGAVDLLAVDEVDRIKATDWAQEKQFQVLNWRYDLVTSQGSGVTLIAANTAPEALDGALASRVRDGRFSVVHMTGRDMRPWAQVITGG